MEFKVEKLKNNVYKVDVTIEKEKVAKAYNEALAHEAENLTVKGFRKGKAPLDIAKENVDKAKLRNHALNHLLTEAYSAIVKENKFNPIVYPRFDIKEFEEEKDLTFIVKIIEQPKIKLGDYNARLKSRKASISAYPDHKVGVADKSKIKSKSKGANKETKGTGLTNQEVIDAIVESCEIEIAEDLITEEVDRMMSSLIDQAGKIGLTVDSYLQSQNKTPQELRDEYKVIAEKNIKADFLITEISKTENVTVTDIEVDQAISAVPDEASKKALQEPSQKMYIKAVLLKNKTIQQLAASAVFDNKKGESK